MSYFTPKIEDLRVGYECEISNISQPGWGKWIIKKLDWESFEGSTIEDLLEIDNIRVPYLTKEQIEKEGWIFKDIYRDGGTSVFEKGAYILEFYATNKMSGSFNIGLHQNVRHQEYSRGKGTFYGECKDINTFRYICKLLGI